MTNDESIIKLKQTFLSQLKLLLDKHKIKESFELFKNEQIRHLIAVDCDLLWEIITLVGARLKGLNEFRFKTFQTCQDILMELSKLCKPKEVLLALLAELENQSDSEGSICDNHFKAFLMPLEYVLICLPTKRNETLKWVLNTLNMHISKIELPEELQLEGKERLLIDQQNEVKRINRLLPSYIKFLETFVNEVDVIKVTDAQPTTKSSSNPSVQRIILLKTLLYLLYHPLINLDLTNETQSESRIFTLEIVKLIAKVNPNFYSLSERTDLINEPSKSDDNELFLNQTSFELSLANLSYLVYCESTEPNIMMPSVYTHAYILGSNLKSIDALLQQAASLICEKGLCLANSLLQKVSDGQLGYESLEQLKCYQIEKSLIQIMVFGNLKSQRQLALTVFKQLIVCFNDECKYHILHSILSQRDQHSGVCALIIKIYKDNISRGKDDYDEVFIGQNLHRFIRSAINNSIPDGENSDLLEKNDIIFGTLNLIRYVFLMDTKDINKTKIWDLKSYINDYFLDTLKKAVELSKNCCKMELKQLTEEIQKGASSKRKNKKPQPEIEIDIVNNRSENLPEINPEEQHKMVVHALLNFDLLESLISRVEEILT